MNKKMIVKNTTTNQHYSLSEKTIILLPSLSNENVILHGIETGKEVQLDVPFNKMKFVQDESEIVGEGRVFTHALDMSKVKVNKIIL